MVEQLKGGFILYWSIVVSEKKVHIFIFLFYNKLEICSDQIFAFYSTCVNQCLTGIISRL